MRHHERAFAHDFARAFVLGEDAFDSAGDPGRQTARTVPVHCLQQMDAALVGPEP